MMNNLYKGWVDLLSKFTDDEEQIQTYWHELASHYSQKHRHYHNLTHIQDLLAQMETWKSEISDPDILRLAIWYHDIIYDITKKDNEERSADLAIRRLEEIGMPEQRRKKCGELIRATKSHEIRGQDKDEDIRWMIDVDLSILGKPWKDYKVYTEKIRKEYSIYPGFLYKRGRRKVLEKFLESDKIFKTETYIRKFEDQARSNIGRELEQL